MKNRVFPLDWLSCSSHLYSSKLIGELTMPRKMKAVLFKNSFFFYNSLKNRKNTYKKGGFPS